jgi:hypothetical protein
MAPSARITSTARFPLIVRRTSLPMRYQSVSLGVAITLSPSPADRRVSSACSRFASSSIPIHRSFRMRFTRSFVTESCCPKRSIAVSMDVLRRSCVFRVTRRIEPIKRSASAARNRSPLERPGTPYDVATTFYFLGGSRKSAYVRRNIFRAGWVIRFAMRKIG